MGDSVNVIWNAISLVVICGSTIYLCSTGGKGKCQSDALTMASTLAMYWIGIALEC